MSSSPYSTARLPLILPKGGRRSLGCLMTGMREERRGFPKSLHVEPCARGRLRGEAHLCGRERSSYATTIISVYERSTQMQGL